MGEAPINKPKFFRTPRWNFLEFTFLKFPTLPLGRWHLFPTTGQLTFFRNSTVPRLALSNASGPLNLQHEPGATPTATRVIGHQQLLASLCATTRLLASCVLAAVGSRQDMYPPALFRGKIAVRFWRSCQP